MTDPRSARSNGRVAHIDMRGRAQAARFVEGQPMTIRTPLAALQDAPNGSMQRQMLFGQRFQVLEQREGHAFGFARQDGYCGYLALDLLSKAFDATHKVCVRRTYFKDTADLKDTSGACGLSFGSRVAVAGTQGGWSEIVVIGESGTREKRFAPAIHLTELSTRFSDPAAIAEVFLGAPYLWGGNSTDGIDCSGLVQAAMLACGQNCPGDSDQQEAQLGVPLVDSQPMKRGDLVFWKGHVAIALDKRRIIHANAHHMAVVVEEIDTAISRIQTAGGGAVTARKRI